MAPQNTPNIKGPTLKPSINGFKMFKLNIRRKGRSNSLDNDSENASVPESPTHTHKHHSNPDEFPKIWDDSPVVNPLKNRPKPREERMPPRMVRRANTEQGESVMPLRIPKLRASTPNLREASTSMETGVSSTHVRNGADQTAGYKMELKHRRLLEEMANNCARELGDRKEWGYWFKAYTDGRYNMSNPPQTPPRDPLLLWIPTPFPADEVDRLQALNRYDISIASKIEADLRTVLRNTATALKAEFASISLIDYESETFLLNHPIRIGAEIRTKRSYSIGAHVMLASDTMVVLDTKQWISKDWRFKGNPSLGFGSSRINFYAGSPLISPDGYNIGVLTITSRTARTTFGKNDLRTLNNFANVVSTHLERLLPESRRRISLLKSKNAGLQARDAENINTFANIPPAREIVVRYSTELEPSPLSPMPQDSKNRMIETRLEAEQKLTAIPYQDYHQGSLPVLPSLPPPPTTVDTLTPRAPPTPPASSTLFPHQQLIQKRPKPQTPPVSPATPPRSPPSPPIPLNLPLTTFPNPKNLPQARTIISTIAKEINFDYLYIIRLEPTSTKLTYKDLLFSQNFQIVMVHSYCRNQPPAGSANQALNTELHMKALRDKCGLTAINTRESSNSVGGGGGGGRRAGGDFYQTSVLLPVQRDYVDDRGRIITGEDHFGGTSVAGREKGGRVCRGYILGAYKRRNTGDSQVAIEKLGEVARRLGDVMF
ncbi:hypothetical protein AA313_de0210063 [Arthrobotrys entomopaga]|nr:hypothetical protein AA313_de0210063 [Arthrobotrys entomopaga]